MLNNRTEKMRLLKYLMACTLLIFVGVIITSRSLAQWPPYNDSGWFSGSSFLNPAFSLSNSPYGNYPLQTSSPDLWSRSLESYGNYSYNDIFSPYSNSFLTSGSFVSPALSLFNSSYGNYSSQTSPLYPEAIYVGQDKGESYTERYNPFFPSISLSFMPNMFNPYTLNIPNPYITSGSPGWFPSWPSPFVPFPSSIIKVPGGRSDPEPALDAYLKMTGEWKSQQLTDEDDNKIKGELEYHRGNDLLKILDSSLPLGEGGLTEFKYTPTRGESPISFKGVFDSGYAAYFSGTANNNRSSGYTEFNFFVVEGTYKIKDNEGQIVDKGTFELF